MITVDEFDSLEVGDNIEAVPVFPNLHPTPVVLRTSQKAIDKAEFVVTYFGITLGKWVCSKSGEKLSWQFA